MTDVGLQWVARRGTSRQGLRPRWVPQSVWPEGNRGVAHGEEGSVGRNPGRAAPERSPRRGAGWVRVAAVSGLRMRQRSAGLWVSCGARVSDLLHDDSA